MNSNSQSEVFAILRSVIYGEKAPEITLPVEYLKKLAEYERMDGFFINSAFKELNLPGNIAMADMIAQKLMLQTAFAVSEKAKEKNIPVAFFKGPVLSNAYSSDICRLSADIDLYVPQKYENEIEAMMLELGAEKAGSISEDQGGEVDFLFRGKMKFEVHYIMCTWLYKSQRDILDKHGVFSENSFVSVKTDEGTYSALDFTDHLILLIYHFWSHFAYSDHKCLRMLCDTAVFVNKYYDKIDFKRLKLILGEISLLKLASAIFRVCEKELGMRHIGFEPLDAGDCKKLVDSLNWNVGKESLEEDELRANFTWSTFIIETSRNEEGKIEIHQKKNFFNQFRKHSRVWVSNCRYWKIYKGQKMNG